MMVVIQAPGEGLQDTQGVAVNEHLLENKGLLTVVITITTLEVFIGCPVSQTR